MKIGGEKQSELDSIDFDLPGEPKCNKRILGGKRREKIF